MEEHSLFINTNKSTLPDMQVKIKERFISSASDVELFMIEQRKQQEENQIQVDLQLNEVSLSLNKFKDHVAKENNQILETFDAMIKQAMRRGKSDSELVLRDIRTDVANI